MKNLISFLVLCFALTATTLATAQQSANSASADVQRKVRPATADEVAKLDRSITSRSVDSLKSHPNSGEPLWVVSASGNSTTGITATACNARAIMPDTTIVGTVTSPDLIQKDRYTFYVIQEVEAGTFCYPLDTDHKYDWNEERGTISYDMWSYDSNSGSLIGHSSVKKMINRYNSDEITTTKLIDAGSTQTQNGVTYIRLEGRIVSSNSVSVMLKDGETDVWYPRPVPPQAISRVGNILRINLAMAGYPVTLYGEIVVIVANYQGNSDQYTVRVKP